MPLLTTGTFSPSKKITSPRLTHKNNASPTNFQSNGGGLQYKVDMENKSRIAIVMD